MTMACSNSNFHKKISSKYRFGRRGRGRWPQLVYRATGKNAGWGRLLIRLDFRLPKMNAGTYLKKDRAGSAGDRLVPQGINRVTEHRTILLRYILDSSNRLTPVFNDRLQLHSRPQPFPSADPMAWRPAGTATDRVATPLTARQKPSAPLSGVAADRVPPMPQQGMAKRSPFNYRSPSRPQLHQETSRRADPPGPAEKSMVFQGQRPLLPVSDLHRHQRGRAHENSTAHLSGFSRLIRNQGSRGILLVHTPSTPDSVQKSPAADQPLSERKLPALWASRRPASAPSGLFLNKSETSLPASELVFKRQRNMESEIEELKKAVARAGEKKPEALPASSTAVQMEIRKQIDLERISDQVYRTIERRIRQERERRGV